jgi:hypothetical protein
LILVEMTDRISTQALLANLAPHVPGGMNLISADWLEAGEKRTPREVTYVISEPSCDVTDVSHRASRILASQTFEIDRLPTPSAKAKRIDIRPYVLSIDVNEQSLRWTQRVTQEGTIRVGEMLTILGLAAGDYLHRVCRFHVDYGA